jgi:hypothetical protein
MASADGFLITAQLEDFRSICEGSGFSYDDFELLQQRATPTGTFYDPQAGRVTVRYKPTGIEMIYEQHSGKNWLSDFSDDLHHGIFGRPKP